MQTPEWGRPRPQQRTPIHRRGPPRSRASTPRHPTAPPSVPTSPCQTPPHPDTTPVTTARIRPQPSPAAASPPSQCSAQQPAHSRHQVRPGRFHHQVKMVSHQAIGMHLEIGFLTGLRQCLEEILPVHIVLEDAFPPIPTAHDVVNGPRTLHSQFTWHWLRSSRITAPRARLWFGTSAKRCLSAAHQGARSPPMNPTRKQFFLNRAASKQFLSVQ